jgi:hypothetical protein
MASGFPICMDGSGCTYDAIPDGIMVLDLFFGRDQAKDPQKFLKDTEINLLQLFSEMCGINMCINFSGI